METQMNTSRSLLVLGVPSPGKGEHMNIGVIGPGDIGEVIVRKLRDADYPVRMANSRGPESLRGLAAKTGAMPVSVEQVVQDVDILFIVVPQKAISKLPKGLLNKAKKETIVPSANQKKKTLGLTSPH